MYHSFTGKKLDLKNPKGFNEKLQWLKIYDRKDIYTTIVDKAEAKTWASSIIGDNYIIPTIGVYNHFDEINFENLPDQFVLKCTHDSAGVIVVKDKAKLNIPEAKKKIEKCLKNNFFYNGREWPYKNVKPRIIIEQYMEQDNVTSNRDELIDYKFYCFNGEPRFLYIAQANFINGQKNDMLRYLDLDWKDTPFGRPDHLQLDIEIEKPPKFDEMISLAKKLSKGIPFVRSDFYFTHGNVYFSELTFFPGSGVGLFSPEEWELEIGSWINLFPK